MTFLIITGELLGEEPEVIICAARVGFIQLKLRVNGEVSGRRMYPHR
jgi:hypothetical protein